MGHRFCDTILDFCDPDQVKVKQVLEELEIMLPKASDSESEEESGAESPADNLSDNEKEKLRKKASFKRKATNGLKKDEKSGA